MYSIMLKAVLCRRFHAHDYYNYHTKTIETNLGLARHLPLALSPSSSPWGNPVSTMLLPRFNITIEPPAAHCCIVENTAVNAYAQHRQLYERGI